MQWDKASWGQKHQLYKNVLRDAWMYYLETFNLSLRPYCPSLHYQSISNILLGYELLGMTRGWFIIYSKASRKLFHSKLQGKWISLLLSPRNYLSSIFQLKVKKWKTTAQSSIMFSPLSYCKRLLFFTQLCLNQFEIVFIGRNVKNHFANFKNKRKTAQNDSNFSSVSFGH